VRKALSFLLFLYCSLLVVLPSHAGMKNNKVTVELKNEITTTAATIYLSDIAKISSNNKTLYSKLKRVVVMKKPRPGVLNVVSRSDVIGYVSQNIENAYNNIIWKGHGYVKIYAAGQKLRLDKLVNVASEYLGEVMSPIYSDYDYQVRSRLNELSVPLGDISLKPHLRSQTINRRQCVWVDVYVNNEHYQTVPVWYSVSAYKNIPIVAYDVKANSYLENEVLDLVRTDVTGMDVSMIYKHESTGTIVFNKNMKSGEKIMQADVKPVSDVMHGQVIQIESHAGNIVVSVKGVAEDDGNVGEIVSVRTINDNDAFSARVINKAVVMVGS